LKRCSYSVTAYEERLRYFSLHIPYDNENEDNYEIHEQEGNPPYAKDNTVCNREKLQIKKLLFQSIFLIHIFYFYFKYQNWKILNLI